MLITVAHVVRVPGDGQFLILIRDTKKKVYLRSIRSGIISDRFLSPADQLLLSAQPGDVLELTLAAKSKERATGSLDPDSNRQVITDAVLVE